MVTNTEKKQDGFSMVELIIVLLVMAIFAVIASSFSRPSLYKADAEAKKLVNAFSYARDYSVSKRSTIRVEIDSTDKMIRVIAENVPSDNLDDRIVSKTPYGTRSNVVLGPPPSNMNSAPTELTPVPQLTFTTPMTYGSANPLKDPPDFGNHLVATYRFKSNGNVIDQGVSSTGANPMLKGATIYVWTPPSKSTNSLFTNAEVLRAITLIGNSGSTNYWLCRLENNVCRKWEKQK